MAPKRRHMAWMDHQLRPFGGVTGPTTRFHARWSRWAGLPAALGEPVRLRALVDVDAGHRLTPAAAHLGDHVGVVVERGGLDDGLGALGRVAGLEDARADEDALGTEL